MGLGGIFQADDIGEFTTVNVKEPEVEYEGLSDLLKNEEIGAVTTVKVKEPEVDYEGLNDLLKNEEIGEVTTVKVNDPEGEAAKPESPIIDATKANDAKPELSAGVDHADEPALTSAAQISPIIDTPEADNGKPESGASVTSKDEPTTPTAAKDTPVIDTPKADDAQPKRRASVTREDGPAPATASANPAGVTVTAADPTPEQPRGPGDRAPSKAKITRGGPSSEPLATSTKAGTHIPVRDHSDNPNKPKPVDPAPLKSGNTTTINVKGAPVQPESAKTTGSYKVIRTDNPVRPAATATTHAAGRSRLQILSDMLGSQLSEMDKNKPAQVIPAQPIPAKPLDNTKPTIKAEDRPPPPKQGWGEAAPVEPVVQPIVETPAQPAPLQEQWAEERANKGGADQSDANQSNDMVEIDLDNAHDDIASHLAKVKDGVYEAPASTKAQEQARNEMDKENEAPEQEQEQTSRNAPRPGGPNQ
jgi:hypothetical protein